MSDTKQPEALRLAQELDGYHTMAHHKLAAIELRRQHEEIAALRAENEALKDARAALAQPEAQPEQQPVRWMAREDWDNAWKQTPVYLEMMDSEDVPLYAGPFTSTPVRWEFRWLNPGGDPSRDGYMGWSLLEPRTAGQTQSQSIHEMMGYRYNDKPVYEVRPLYAGPALPNEGDSDGR